MSEPVTLAEFGRLQQTRNQAQQWADRCEVDVLLARRKLYQATAEQAIATEALELATRKYEAGRRVVHGPSTRSVE